MLAGPGTPRVAATPPAGGVSTGCPSGETPYDPARLRRLVHRLEGWGVVVKIDEESGRLARRLGAEAVYMFDEGLPGILVLPQRPTCAQVLEELFHVLQHRQAAWGDVTERLPQLELAAQDRMMALARRRGWPAADVAQLARARARWEART